MPHEQSSLLSSLEPEASACAGQDLRDVAVCWALLPCGILRHAWGAVEEQQGVQVGVCNSDVGWHKRHVAAHDIRRVVDLNTLNDLQVTAHTSRHGSSACFNPVPRQTFDTAALNRPIWHIRCVYVGDSTPAMRCGLFWRAAH